MEKTLFVCACNSTEHQIVFTSFEDEVSKEVFVEIHLTQKSFWNRLKHGIKYIFGYQCKYGAFDEIILNDTHAAQLRNISAFLEQQPINR